MRSLPRHPQIVRTGLYWYNGTQSLVSGCPGLLILAVHWEIDPIYVRNLRWSDVDRVNARTLSS